MGNRSSAADSCFCLIVPGFQGLHGCQVPHRCRSRCCKPRESPHIQAAMRHSPSKPHIVNVRNRLVSRAACKLHLIA